MKIQLDTENKTIKLERDVELSKLIELLEELLPNGKWREFTLQTGSTASSIATPSTVTIENDPWWKSRYHVTPLVTGTDFNIQA